MNQPAKLPIILKIVAFVAFGIIGLVLIWAAMKLSGQVSTPKTSSRVIDLSNVAPGATVGKIDQFLNVNANATFNGPVRINRDLIINGKVTNKDGVSLFDTSATGSSGSNTDLAALNVRGNLTVGGSGSFGTNLTSSNLSVQRANIASLVLSGHITSGGARPRASGDTAALGGAISLNGNDTSGTITINTGTTGSIGNTGLAGSLVGVTFAAPYSLTPRVNITPVGPDAAALQYYATRSATNFTIQTISPTKPNTTYTFDYFVIQ